MKTAIQTLIDEISKSPISNLSILNLIENLRLLEMEKEQIMEAYWEGGQWVPKHITSCERYYNETFNTEKQC